MLTGVRSLSLASRTAPLPQVPQLRFLTEAGAVVRQGQLVVVFGYPASGKSTFVQWWANEMDIDCIYFSADMDAHDAISRLGAQRTGWTVDSIEEMMHAGAEDMIADDLADSKIVWCYDSGPTLQDIVDQIDAYVEVYLKYPKAIVIDNAMNVEGEMEDDHGGLRLVFKELHRFAHETGITVFLLHHAREEGDVTVPPSRDKMQGKTSQLPELVLAVCLVEDEFRIAIVKSRKGKQDPTGKTYYRLTAEPERATFREYSPPPATYPTVEWDGRSW
jgi:hypothetical protein